MMWCWSNSWYIYIGPIIYRAFGTVSLLIFQPVSGIYKITPYCPQSCYLHVYTHHCRGVFPPRVCTVLYCSFDRITQSFFFHQKNMAMKKKRGRPLPPHVPVQPGQIKKKLRYLVSCPIELNLFNPVRVYPGVCWWWRASVHVTSRSVEQILNSRPPPQGFPRLKTFLFFLKKFFMRVR